VRDEGTRGLARRAGAALAPLGLWALALAVWPGAAQPFSGVKSLLLLGLGGLAAALGAWAGAPGRAEAQGRAAGAWRGLAALWLAGPALSALLGEGGAPLPLAREVGGGLLLLGLLLAPPPPRATRRAAAGAGAAVAAVAVLQAAGADPFAWAGWAPQGAGGGRMHVYGTLGNPTFVAALLGATLCLTAGEEARAVGRPARLGWGLAAVVQGAALAATRSWGALLALAAAGLVAGAVAAPSGGGRPGRAARWTGLGLLAALLVLGLSVAGRPVGRVVEGRRYLWQVAAPQLAAAPLLGQGPGAFEARWPEWEAGHWGQGRAGPQQARFRGRQDHAHQDVLEWLLELGLLGTLPRLVLLGLALWRAVAAREAALAAALTALLVRAQVDFPLARPAELGLLVALVALCGALPAGRGASAGRRSGPPAVAR
jgi:O-antigen ligase